VADSEAPARPRRGWTIGIGIGVGIAAAIAIAFALLAFRDDTEPSGRSSSASRALARLDANGGRAYVGTIDEAEDAVRLRRAVRAELRSDASRTARGGDPGVARRCAALLRRTSTGGKGRVVLLADATFAGDPAVVVGITDQGRIVVFVADAATCAVRMAQSL
jgi:hypothetical protein